jgi:hypothetical protein
MKFEFSDRFLKNSCIKFNENPFSRSRVVPHGWTDGQTDMMKLIVAFCNCANMPENKLLMMYQEEINSIVESRVEGGTLWGGISFPVFYIS